MGFFLIKRTEIVMRQGTIAECLFIPDVSPELVYSPLYDAIRLANLWRLRRERPYVVACIDNQRLCDEKEDDSAYLRSLPRFDVEQGEANRALIYAGQGDISPLLPVSEEDFLLFLPQPPSAAIPAWPSLVAELDGVLVSQVDEFMKIQTTDAALIKLFQRLPVYERVADDGRR